MIFTCPLWEKHVKFGLAGLTAGSLLMIFALYIGSRGFFFFLDISYLEPGSSARINGARTSTLSVQTHLVDDLKRFAVKNGISCLCMDDVACVGGRVQGTGWLKL